jgi:hypothetical protein
VAFKPLASKTGSLVTTSPDVTTLASAPGKAVGIYSVA